MSDIFKAGDKVIALGGEATVLKQDPGAGVSENLILVKLANGTERYVTRFYLESQNPKAKAAPKKEVKPPVPAPETKKAPEVAVPKAKAPVKKSTAKKKTPAKKSTKAKK